MPSGAAFTLPRGYTRLARHRLSQRHRAWMTTPFAVRFPAGHITRTRSAPIP